MSLLKDSIISPFSPHSITEEHNRSLLLQFLLHELFELSLSQQIPPLSEKLNSSKVWHLPYDWAINRGPLNKALEYASLLPLAFPTHQKTATKVLKGLNKIDARNCSAIKELYQLIERFFTECEDDENLLLFLLKHNKQIDSLMGQSYLRTYLLKLYPQGLRSLEEMVSDHYHERGFFSLIPELKELILALEND